MTYEELKAEAKRQGYRLSKIKKNVPHVRCKCGGVGELWFKSSCGDYVRCRRCDASADWATSARGAWINWYTLNEGEWVE